jgi:hypothetical protein
LYLHFLIKTLGPDVLQCDLPVDHTGGGTDLDSVVGREVSGGGDAAAAVVLMLRGDDGAAIVPGGGLVLTVTMVSHDQS